MSFDTQRYLDSIYADVERVESDLFDDQRAAIEFTWNNPFSALYLDVGKGKTAISLSVVDRLFCEGYTGKVLVIAPIRVANRVWPQEPRLWSHLAYLGTTVLRVEDDDPRLKGFNGSAKTKRKHALLRGLLDSPKPIHVINREAVRWLVDECKRRKRWPYKVIFFDEASVLGDHKNEVFKAIKEVRSKLIRLHELTATPASQSYMRFFSQIWLLDKGERFGNHITPFRERYFTYNPYQRKWTIRPGSAEEIEAKIADICLVMRREKDFQVNVRPIRLSPKALTEYQEFERDLVLRLPDDTVIDAINGAVLSNKLLQFASGAIYDEHKRYHVIHDEKIEDLKSLAEETLDNPILVSYWYKSSLERLRKAFPKAAVMDKAGRLEEPWNKGKFKLLLCHPRSVGHGLNMQHGGHHLAIFDIFWPLDLFTQLVGRLDRQGQVKQVMVHMLSAHGTMDDVVSANLRFLQGAEESMFKRLQDLRKQCQI